MATYEVDADGNIIFKSEETKQYQPVPLGDYVLTVESAEMREGRKAPYIALEMMVVHEDEDFNGVRVWDNVSLKAPWRLTQIARSLGHEVEEGEEVQLNIFDLYGEYLEARLIVTTNIHQRQINEIDQYLPKGTIPGTPDSKEETPPKKTSARRKTTKKKK